MSDQSFTNHAVPPRDNQPEPRMWAGQAMHQRQHRGVQAQDSGKGQKQSQGQGRDESRQEQRQSPDAPQDAPDLQAPDSGFPLAGEHPAAIDNPAGAPRPVYDQYELNAPQNMHQDEAEEAMRREQASQQPDEDAVGKAHNADGSPGLGYGSDESDEMAGAPHVTEKQVTDEKDGSQEKQRGA